MERIPCTLGMLTFNSEKTLRRALQSVRDFDDILLVDGGSTDDTLAIAQEFGARIIAQDARHKDANNRLVNYGGARQQFLEAAKHDWILYIDSDETISEGLHEEIRAITTTVLTPMSPLVYEVPIGIVIDGHHIKYSANYPGYQTRFFNRKSGARFIKAVHERIDFDRTQVIVGRVKNPWHTHTERTEWTQYLAETRAHRRTEIAARCRQPFRDYICLALGRNLRRSAAVIVKATIIYLRHGFKDSMPIEGEIGRALAPLIVAWGITACRFNLPGQIAPRP